MRYNNQSVINDLPLCYHEKSLEVTSMDILQLSLKKVNKMTIEINYLKQSLGKRVVALRNDC